MNTFDIGESNCIVCSCHLLYRFKLPFLIGLVSDSCVADPGSMSGHEGKRWATVTYDASAFPGAMRGSLHDSEAAVDKDNKQESQTTEDEKKRQKRETERKWDASGRRPLPKRKKIAE